MENTAPEVLDEVGDLVVRNECRQDDLSGDSPRRPLADRIGFFGIRLRGPESDFEGEQGRDAQGYAEQDHEDGE